MFNKMVLMGNSVYIIQKSFKKYNKGIKNIDIKIKAIDRRFDSGQFIEKKIR
jgi:hypothetical protein